MQKYVAGLAVLGLIACGGGDEPKSTNNGAPNNGAPNNIQANNGAPNNGAPNNGAPNNGAPNNGEQEPTYTYYEDVKPIVDAKCATCHTQDGIGPFPLTSFEEVSGVASVVQAAVQNLDMPPFIYANECRDYTHDPTLEPEQIEKITTWVDEGTPEGDSANEGEPIEVPVPEVPDFDTTLPIPEYTPKQSPDDYRCFVVDWPHDTTKYVTGFGVEPGNDKIVHHVIGFLAPPDAVETAESLDEAEAGDGYTCFGGPGFDNTGWVGSWAPGGVPAKYPETTGITIEPGSKMVIQVHYNTLTEEPAPDATKLHFETADEVENPAMWMPWANPAWLQGNGMNIPAGQADATASFAYDPTSFAGGGPLKIWAAGLHMHLLGTSIRASIKRSGGDEECLAESPKWDFDWQTGVTFAEPTVLNPGDQLALECHWDNTMENQPIVNGERVQPADRSWGEGTMDEMCLGIFYVTNAN